MGDRDIEAELRSLFGQEEDWIVEDNWEELVLSEVSIPATTLSPDDLFSILDQAGILRTPSATEDRIREDFDLPDEAGLDDWSVLKTHHVELVRDLSITGRIAYKVEYSPLEQDDLGFHAVPVSKLWSGNWAPSFANFGALLGGEDGLFRAGIEIGEGDLKAACSRLMETIPPTSMIKQMEEMTVLIREISTELSKVRSTVQELRADNARLHGVIEKQTEDFKSQVVVLTREIKEVGKLVIKFEPKNQPDLHQAVSDLEEKLQSRMTANQASQLSLLREREKERDDQRVRSKNLRIVGLTETEGENTTEVVTEFFQETLRVSSPRVESVRRIGVNSDRGPRTLLVRFHSEDDKNIVLSNRNMLRGKRIWLDMDLTPAQQVQKKEELQKVKEAIADGWVAYLKEGCAVITTRKREQTL
ncbi:hypothetical protein R1sor_027229 [Riccia sorocarpa]|uniref:RRM domain-containing protein n=1 Tax=Riccia sorocarpa TaxID=122646 RepID=A0ABD3GFA6_9MARC